MSSLRKLITVGLATIGLLTGVQAQCLNEVAANNPNLRTMSENSSKSVSRVIETILILAAWFLVPVSQKAVQAALDASYGTVLGVSNVQLVPLPTSDKSLFPKGFASDKHTVLVNAGLGDDIRMAVAQIDGPLIMGQIIIPFVRRYNSKPATVLQAQLNGYLAGPGNNQVAGLVPSTVSTVIEGYPQRLGQFSPDATAYMLNGGILENKVAWAVAPNPVTGPGVYIEAADFQFISGKLSSTTIKLFKYMLNQPAVLSGAVGALDGGLCQRNQVYFTNDTSTIYPRVGNVTLGPAADGIAVQTSGTLQTASPSGNGVYTKLEGFSACGQNVGYNPENCDDASLNVDKSAL